MIQDTMYNRLLMLPFLNGLTSEELTSIIARIHMDFNQMKDGECIASQGERCDRLTYVLGGKICAELMDSDNKFILTETLDEPFVIEPENIYGLNQRYSRTYTVIDGADTVSISKHEFNNVMLSHYIVKVNMMNMFCANIQRLNSTIRRPEPESVLLKVVKFLQAFTLSKTGEKRIDIKMEDLAGFIRETRLNVSFALRQLNDEGLIIQGKRASITIPDFQKFLDTYTL